MVVKARSSSPQQQRPQRSRVFARARLSLRAALRILSRRSSWAWTYMLGLLPGRRTPGIVPEVSVSRHRRQHVRDGRPDVGRDPGYAPAAEVRMSASSRFPTHHVPDDGTRYEPGEMVRVDHSSGRVQIIKDPFGGYEVMNCRRATEYAGGAPLLRVGLRKRGAPPAVEDTPPWAPRRPHGR